VQLTLSKSKQHNQLSLHLLLKHLKENLLEEVPKSLPCLPLKPISMSFLLVIFLRYLTFSGGLNATALCKFLQADGVNYKMALITDRSRYILPEAYFGVSHGHIAELKLESGTVSA